MNKSSSDQFELLNMLQAVADQSRLQILQSVSKQEFTVGELAEKMDLSLPTISHHLACLRRAGLVSLRVAKNQHFYSLHTNGLAHFKQLIQTIEQSEEIAPVLVSHDEWIDQLDGSEEDRKILRDHTQDGVITHLPGKQKKMDVLLRWLSTLFEKNRIYSETEVNLILKAVYEEDFVSLRRDMIDMGYLRRERGGGKYWLVPADSDQD